MGESKRDAAPEAGPPAGPGITAASTVVIDWPRAILATKEQQVAEFLREKIISGVFGRGQKLKQDEIAKQLNISITPVREALKMLEAQGYVQGFSHRGVVVAPFEIEKAKELFELRLLLEGRLTRAAAKNMTPADLEALEELDRENVRAAASEVPQALRRANYRFHFRLYEVAQQPLTLEFVRVLWAKFPFDLVGTIPGRPARANREHENFLRALRDGDPRKATTAMQEHIESNWHEFRAKYPLYHAK